MTTVTVDVRLYTLDLEQITTLASEFIGSLVAPTAADEGYSVDFGFENPAYAASFRNSLNTCFTAPPLSE